MLISRTMPEYFLFRNAVYAMAVGQEGYVYASAILVDTYSDSWVRREAFVSNKLVTYTSALDPHIKIICKEVGIYHLDLRGVSHLWLPVEYVDSSKYLPIHTVIYEERQ